MQKSPTGRRRRIIFLVAALVALLALAFVLNTARQAAQWSLAPEAPAERLERLEAAWRLKQPTDRPPEGLAILLSGCDGVADNMDYWADLFVSRGHAALILDSHGPRGLDRAQAWRLVCAGQVLSGAERAGDIAVAIDAFPDLAAGGVILLGASHGGWTAMEFMGLSGSGTVPPGLTAWPAPPETLKGRVATMVLLYPYCGVLNGAEADLWTGAPPSLFVLAEDDSIVSAPDCVDRAEAYRRTGAEIETVVLADADHGFDQRDRSILSTLAFDAAQTEIARQAVERFLNENGL